MKTNLSFANPAELQTECLVVVALDHGQMEKIEVSVEANEAEIKDAVKDVIASREVTAKIFEPTLLHRPAKLKAKRLLLLGGGINQTRVRCRIFRLEILDRFKVGGIGHDFGELL